MSETGTCRDCGERIIWVETDNGRRMALDHEPIRRYVISAGESPIKARQRNTYDCHFDTCKRRKRA